MNGLPLSSVCILVEYGNDITLLGWDDSTSGDDRDVNHLMVVDALDADLPPCLVDHADVVTCDATIGATVDQSTMTNFSMHGSRVRGLCEVDLSIFDTIDLDVRAMSSGGGFGGVG